MTDTWEAEEAASQYCREPTGVRGFVPHLVVPAVVIASDGGTVVEKARIPALGGGNRIKDTWPGEVVA